MLVVRFASLSQSFDSNLHDPLFLLFLVTFIERLVDLIENICFDVDDLVSDVKPFFLSYIGCCRRGSGCVLRRVYVDGEMKRSKEGDSRYIGME